MVCSFYSPAKHFRERSENPKSVIQSIFLISCFSSPKSSGKMECNYNCLLNECLSNLRNNVSQSRKTFMKKRSYYTKSFSPGKSFLGMQNKNFQSRRFFCENSFFVRRPKPKRKIKISLGNSVVPQNFCGHVGWNFDDTAKFFSKNTQKNPH